MLTRSRCSEGPSLTLATQSKSARAQERHSERESARANEQAIVRDGQQHVAAEDVGNMLLAAFNYALEN